MAKFDYKKAEADLYDVGARHPDEIYECATYYLWRFQN